jgi:hypothetical protein
MLAVLAQFKEAVSEARRFARGQNSQIAVGYMRALDAQFRTLSLRQATQASNFTIMVYPQLGSTLRR